MCGLCDHQKRQWYLRRLQHHAQEEQSGAQRTFDKPTFVESIRMDIHLQSVEDHPDKLEQVGPCVPVRRTCPQHPDSS